MANELAELLAYENPEYQDMQACWEFWEDSSIGGKRWRDGNHLVKHPREDDTPDAYKYRERLSMYEPWGKHVSEDWIGRLYGPGASLAMCDDKSTSDVRRKCEMIETNFDLLGTDMRTFCMKLSKQTVDMGSVGAFVDVPPEGKYVKSLYDADRLNLRAFARRVPAKHILDWDFDKLNGLAWVKIREPACFPRSWKDPYDESGQGLQTADLQRHLRGSNVADAFGEPRDKQNTNKSFKQAYRYFVIEKNQTLRYDPVAEDRWDLTVINHDLGYLPFVMGYWDRPDPGVMFARSPLEDIYYFSDLIYQLRSMVVEVQTNQGFSIFVFAGYGDQDEKQEMMVGTKKAIKVPGGEGFPPFFASPDSDIPKVHIEHIRQLERAIVRMAKGDSRSLVDDGGIKEQSGRSKTFDADEKTSLLRNAADCQESFLTTLLKLVHKRSNIGNEFSGIVKLPDSFSLRGVLQECEETIALVNCLVESPTAMKAAKRHLVHSNMQSMMSPEEMAEVDSEINEASIEELAAAIYANASQQNGSGATNGLQSQEGAGGKQEQTGPEIKRANRRGQPQIGRPRGSA